MIIGLFGRILSLSQGSFAKETYNFKEPTTCSHPIVKCADTRQVFHDADRAKRNLLPQRGIYGAVGCIELWYHLHRCARVCVYVCACVYVWEFDKLSAVSSCGII